MTDPLRDAIEKAKPEAEAPPVTSMRIDKLADGGFLVGTHAGAVFATDGLEKALQYIGRALMPKLDRAAAKYRDYEPVSGF